MITVLYTVNGMRVNGMSAVIMQYIRGLDKNKYRFLLFTDEIAEQFLDELKDNCVNVIQSDSRGKNQVTYFFELCSILKKNKIDIIHAHGNSATIAVEMLAAKISGVPIRIAHSHNTTCMHKTMDKLLRPLFYCTYTDGIGCGVEAGKWLFNNRRHRVIKNGIDLEKFKYNPEERTRIRKELGLIDQYVIGHVGRFTDQKNHDAILRIFREFLQERDAMLLLVGDGPREAEIRDLAKMMRLDDKVIFYGTTKDTSAMYSAMDVFLFPSKFEGVPLTLVEAQANGLHCVISDKISNEVNLTSLIHVMPLEREYEWTTMLVQDTMHREEDSTLAISQLTQSGFASKEVIKSIDSLYQKAMNNC